MELELLVRRIAVRKGVKANSCYRVRYRPANEEIAWPGKPTGELLGEALGSERMITSTQHPIYQELIDGTEMS